MTTGRKQPAWLAAALKQAPKVDLQLGMREQLPRSGDLCVINPMDGGERAIHCVVVAADAEPRRATRGAPRAVLMALVTADIESAIQADLICMGDETGLPYDVIVRTDLIGPVLLHQCGPALGRIADPTGDLIQTVIREGVSSLPAARVGLALRSSDDPRLALKERDRVLFEHMTVAGRREVLVPELAIGALSLGDDPVRIVEAQQAGRIIPPDAFEELAAQAVSMGLSNDLATVRAEGDLQCAAAGIPAVRSSGRSTWSPALPGSPQAEHRLGAWLLDVREQAGRCSVRLYADPETIDKPVHRVAWHGRPTIQVVMERERA